MISTRVFTLVLLLLGAALPAHAQLCGNTAPLAENPGQGGIFGPHDGLGESPEADQVIVFRGSTHFVFEPTTLVEVSDATLADKATGHRFARTAVSPAAHDRIFIAEENAYVESLVDTLESVVWRRNLSRSGCTTDTLPSSPPPHHYRPTASAGFQAAYTNDLVYIGTRYIDGPGCTSGGNTDNRIYALSGDTGAIEWTFNGSMHEDMDGISGMVLDETADRLFVATERTDPTAHSVWALDVLTGSKVWSVNAGRSLFVPVLHAGRLYVANVAGEIKALDPADGSEIWSVSTGSTLVPAAAPTTALSVVEVAGTGTLAVIVDFFGQVHVVRDDGGAGTALAWFSLPSGAAGSVGFPFVQATSHILMDATGTGLVGANDGKVYPLDLVAGTVGTPIVVNVAAASVDHLLLEPPGVFGFPASFLLSTGDKLARYCTTLGAGTAVPAATAPGLALLAGLFVAVAAVARSAGRRKQ